MNKTYYDFSPHSHFNDFIKDTLKTYHNQIAFSNMGVCLTFSQLDTLSDHFCSFLQNELHIQKGDKVAVQMPNLLQYPICVLGILKAGAILVNVNPLYTKRELKEELQDSQAKALIGVSLFADNLNDIKTSYLKNIVITHVEDLMPFFKAHLVSFVLKYIKRKVPKNKLKNFYPFKEALELGSQNKIKKVPLSFKDILCLQYTGGTTGVAKGVMLTQENILSNIYQMEAFLKTHLQKEKEIMLTALPLYHIFSFTVNFMLSLKMGWHNVLVTNPRDLKGLTKTFKKYKPTIFTGVNTLFNALNNFSDFKKIPFHLKTTIAGGASLQEPVGKKWRDITHCSIAEGYGLTEASPVVSCNLLDKPQYNSIGVPLEKTQVKIVDEKGVAVAEGREGELLIKGPQVMRGYWNNQKATDKVLHDGWLKTGDIAQKDSLGFLHIVDRKKDMILVSGFNVYPNEIELVISSHPLVLEVACIGVPDSHSGEVPKVFVVLKKNKSLAEEDLRVFLEKKLTNYKQPKYIEFKKSLPKSNIGKILRKKLRD